MSIGFSFKGRIRKIERFTGWARKLADRGGYKLTEAADGLQFSLCAMGDLTIQWKKGTGLLSHWEAFGNCYSTPSGAGFHKAAIELLEDLARGPFHLTEVLDETEFYENRDFEQMREQHFYPWLKTLIRLCQEKIGAKEYQSLCLCWNVEQYQPEEIEGTVVTPMGRFDIKSLAKAVETLGIRWFADRFFIWNRPERDAGYYRNTALNLLWEDCCFQSSSVRVMDQQCNQAIIWSLERAYQLEPLLPLPVTAYQEICALDNHTMVIPETAPQLEETYSIGYRRGEITHAFDSLRLTLPGAYQYEWEDGGDRSQALWWDGDESHPLWRVSGFYKQTGEAEIRSEWQKERDLEELEMENGRAKWGWTTQQSEQGEFYQILCEAVCGLAHFLITVTYFDQKDRDGIYALLQKLKVVKPVPPEEHSESYSEQS